MGKFTEFCKGEVTASRVPGLAGCLMPAGLGVCAEGVRGLALGRGSRL